MGAWQDPPDNSRRAATERRRDRERTDPKGKITPEEIDESLRRLNLALYGNEDGPTGKKAKHGEQEDKEGGK